jgi:hypothetical protein
LWWGKWCNLPGGVVTALEEAIHVIRLMWSGGRGLRYKGK